MVVARRDPPLHVDAHDAASPNFNAYAAPKASKLARFLTVMQVTGSLLAVPVGIASAYSFYRANFSPETTCQGLRNNIVALLDKSVDATTRRVLVRRDVETFEKTCGSVDPDATAAFKTLLAVEKAAVPPAVAPSAPKVQRNETAAKDSIHKPEPRPQTPKQAVTPANSAVPEPARRDAAISDTQWLDAVRQALVTHKEDARATETGPPVLDAAKPQTIPAPVVRPASRDVGSASPAAATAKSGTVPTAPAMTPIVAPVVAPAPGPSVAPPLPPAIPIAPPPAAAQATENHPVPPESIPESAPPASADTAESGRSRIGKWISAIPLLGPVVDNVRH
jgi:hypothetical protein